MLDRLAGFDENMAAFEFDPREMRGEQRAILGGECVQQHIGGAEVVGYRHGLALS